MTTKKRGHSHHPDRVGHTAAPNASPDRGGHPEAAVVPRAGADDRSRSIRVRAYALWEQAGRPDGDGAREQFWLKAETEVAAGRAGP